MMEKKQNRSQKGVDYTRLTIRSTRLEMEVCEDITSDEGHDTLSAFFMHGITRALGAMHASMTAEEVRQYDWRAANALREQQIEVLRDAKRRNNESTTYLDETRRTISLDTRALREIKRATGTFRASRGRELGTISDAIRVCMWRMIDGEKLVENGLAGLEPVEPMPAKLAHVEPAPTEPMPEEPAPTVSASTESAPEASEAHKPPPETAPQAESPPAATEIHEPIPESASQPATGSAAKPRNNDGSAQGDLFQSTETPKRKNAKRKKSRASAKKAKKAKAAAESQPGFIFTEPEHEAASDDFAHETADDETDYVETDYIVIEDDAENAELETPQGRFSAIYDKSKAWLRRNPSCERMQPFSEIRNDLDVAIGGKDYIAAFDLLIPYVKQGNRAARVEFSNIFFGKKSGNRLGKLGVHRYDETYLYFNDSGFLDFLRHILMGAVGYFLLFDPNILTHTAKAVASLGIGEWLFVAGFFSVYLALLYVLSQRARAMIRLLPGDIARLPINIPIMIYKTACDYLGFLWLILGHVMIGLAIVCFGVWNRIRFMALYIRFWYIKGRIAMQRDSLRLVKYFLKFFLGYLDRFIMLCFVLLLPTIINMFLGTVKIAKREADTYVAIAESVKYIFDYLGRFILAFDLIFPVLIASLVGTFLIFNIRLACIVMHDHHRFWRIGDNFEGIKFAFPRVFAIVVMLCIFYASIKQWVLSAMETILRWYDAISFEIRIAKHKFILLRIKEESLIDAFFGVLQ